MRVLKIIFAAVMVLCLVMCSPQKKTEEHEIFKQIPASIVTNLPVNPAMKLVQDMGIGINIGNTLDAIGTHTWHSGENGWGNPDITREFIQVLKNYGYKSIRLPVTWAEYMGPAPNYLIGDCVFDNCYDCPNRMDRVEEVVRWILEEDMYCVLNIHHDGGYSDKSWILEASTNPEKVADIFSKVWTQIATRFANVSQDKLIFESMNEVGFNDIWNGQGMRGKDRAYEILNMLNQTFVDTVRKIPGNENRFLLIAGYWTNIEQSCDPFFIMPDDTITDRLILSVHYYDPATFCIAEQPDNSWGFRDTWGTPVDYFHLTTEFNKLKTRYLERGFPVILGEYGVTLRNKVEEDRVRWMASVKKICLNYGIHPMLWDTGGEISRHPPFEMRDSLKAVWDLF